MAQVMSYELTIALKSDLSAQAAKKVVAGLEELVKGAGGRIEKLESMGIKSLAYPIKGATQASFARLMFDLSPKEVPGLQNEVARNEDLLRAVIIKGGESVVQ